MITRGVLCVACHAKVTMVVHMSFSVRSLRLVFLIFLHLLEDFQVRLSLLYERPSVNILSTHIIFVVHIYFFFVIEDILYLFTRKL